MDFFSNLAKSDESKPTDPDHHQKPDLFGSAKLVAEAAQAQFGNEQSDKYDKAKVASAAADLLGGACDYAKMDETKGVGKYVDQAEDYLRQYGTSHTITTTTTTVADSGGEKTTTVAAASTTVTTEPVKDAAESDAGDYIKKAEGLLNKPSGGEGHGGGGSADFMKMAGDFLHKPSGGGGEEGGAAGFMKMAGDFMKK
ncbi:uncharacterized protein [Henckelia pumila]|uniref:uncharacterized protein n=1 Tax=Henckelia pumila TaxID=405737 RepID=UPI003C6E88C8